MSAKIYNLEAERYRRGKGDAHTAAIFQNLARGPDMQHISDEQLVEWAHRLANASDDDTIQTIVDDVEAILAKGGTSGR